LNIVEQIVRGLPYTACLICGGPPDVVGLFRPFDPASWGAPEGKDRVFRYCLCRRCNGLEDKEERVEKIIRSKLSNGTIGCKVH